MMDAVIVEESEIHGCGQVEDAKEFNRSQQLLGGESAHAFGNPFVVPVIPVDQFGGRLGLVGLGGVLHLEIQVGNAVQELYVGVGEMPGQFPSGASIGVGAIVAFIVGNTAQDFLGSFHFVGKTIEHGVAIGQSKFGSESLG